MTDLEKFVELYKSVGIDVDIVEDLKNKTKSFYLCVDEYDKITGYLDFYTEIIFDNNGNFIKQEIRE